MALLVYDISLELITQLRPVIHRVDRNLADQLKRAASSVPLNIAEGSQGLGGNERLRYRTAPGSAAEVSAALDVAEAWAYVSERELAASRQTLDRVRAMLYGLARQSGEARDAPRGPLPSR